MADLRLEELSAQTAAAANGLTLKPGQEAFLEPETYEHLEQTLDPANSWPRVVREGDEVVGYIMGNSTRTPPKISCGPRSGASTSPAAPRARASAASR